MYDRIKHYNDTGLWSIERVWNVVGKVINEVEFQEITGFVYPEKSEQSL